MLQALYVILAYIELDRGMLGLYGVIWGSKNGNGKLKLPYYDRVFLGATEKYGGIWE